MIIANMMLYHVPDLEKGLSEVRRVLKKDGKFYCATYGEDGIVSFIAGLLKPYGAEDWVNKNVTLQNGKQILARYFSSVERLEYMDALKVTNIEDMLDYLYSLTGMEEIFLHIKRCRSESIGAKYDRWSFERAKEIRDVCLPIKENSVRRYNISTVSEVKK